MVSSFRLYQFHKGRDMYSMSIWRRQISRSKESDAVPERKNEGEGNGEVWKEWELGKDGGKRILNLSEMERRRKEYEQIL